MKLLNPPTINPIELYQRTVNRKQLENREILTAIENLIVARYNEFEEKKSSLETIDQFPLTAEQKLALKDCYNSDKSSIIKSELLNAVYNIQAPTQKRYCNYCGADRPSSLDHYMPKSKFPEYSIYPANLLPCCLICNNDRNNDWLINGIRSTINFYTDEFIENTKFLHCNIDVNWTDELTNPSITYTFRLDTDMLSDYNAQIVQNHFTSYKLLTLFTDNASTDLSSIITSIIFNGVRSKEDCLELLREQIVHHQNTRGLNSMHTAALQGLYDSQSFNEWIDQF